MMPYARKTCLLRADIERVEQVKDYIKNHLRENLDTENLAKRFSVSSVTLSRHFEDFIGISIYRFVLKIRMEQSIKLLAKKDGALSEIARKVGFNHYSVFSRTFKRYYGRSPSYHLKKQAKS